MIGVSCLGKTKRQIAEGSPFDVPSQFGATIGVPLTIATTVPLLFAWVVSIPGARLLLIEMCGFSFCWVL